MFSMEIFSELKESKNLSLALGFFDGIHEGHQVVIKNAINIAKTMGTKSGILMFKEHPLSFISHKKINNILNLEDKLRYLEKTGVDEVYLLDFPKFENLSAEEYIKNIIFRYFSPVAITTGFNHNFGKNKSGNPSLLRELQKEYGYKYYEIPPITCNQSVISSSIVKKSIEEGNVYFAQSLLGYRFFIRSKVIEGQHIASTLGFPSANFIYPENIVKIPNGVYYVIVTCRGKKYNGILNHSDCPSLFPTKEPKTEVHLLDFNEDIYGEDIKISFVTKIRNELNFENEEKLSAQLLRDKAFVEIFKYYVN